MKYGNQKVISSRILFFKFKGQFIESFRGKEKLQIEYNESYWEQHYSLVRERIPRFLEPFAEKILNTGKYLNVVSDCGVTIEQRHEPLRYLVNPRQLEGAINKCYQYSAKRKTFSNYCKI